MTEPTPHFCDCGCGIQTNIAPRSSASRGYVKGLSYRFIGRHHAWKGDQASYDVKHASLRYHFPKSGICEECGAAASRTEYALIHGRRYSRHREDYRELCLFCHRGYDSGGTRQPNAKLTDAIVIDIRKRHARGKGERLWVLAREYGVSLATVQRAAIGKSWRHLR